LQPPRSTPFPYTTLCRSMTVAPDGALYVADWTGTSVSYDSDGLKNGLQLTLLSIAIPFFSVNPDPIFLPTPNRHGGATPILRTRSEEHTSELQSLAYLDC